MSCRVLKINRINLCCILHFYVYCQLLYLSLLLLEMLVFHILSFFTSLMLVMRPIIDMVKLVSISFIVLVWLRICLAKRLSASFVFGDSLVDVGNNNYITSLAKADHFPNGIDFGMTTGRFTNGRTIADILGCELGLKDYTPPYLAPTTVGHIVLKGVNYASAGAGILNETGKIFVGRITLDAQLDSFAKTRQDIISTIGVSAAEELFNGALFSITIGSNDFIDNYLIPIISTIEQTIVSPEAFVADMISRFRFQLTRVYDMGARKILVPNVAPIGCIPYMRDINPSARDDCATFPNHLAQLFNLQLKVLLQDLSFSLEGSSFLFADVYRLVTNIVQNFKSYGFDYADSACCYAAGEHGGLVPCGPTSKLCPDRSKYVFWDPYHPTDATNTIVAKRLMDGDIKDISPFNLRALFKS